MRSKTSATLMLVLTFGLGVVAGAVSNHLYETRFKPAGPRPGARSAPPDIAEELGQGLNLNADQKNKLKEIIQQSRERYRTMSQQFRPQYDAVRDETRQQIRQILTEEQKARFEKIINEMDERHKGRERRPGPGSGPGR
jgi:Spy/CpxP family protein refolding chaperone